MNFFYSPYLPAQPELNSKYRELVVKYPDIHKYLYVTTLQKLLFALSEQEQKELILALESSEGLAQKWLEKHGHLVSLITENLERSILATHSQLV